MAERAENARKREKNAPGTNEDSARESMGTHCLTAVEERSHNEKARQFIHFYFDVINQSQGTVHDIF